MYLLCVMWMISVTFLAESAAYDILHKTGILPSAIDSGHVMYSCMQK